MYTLRTLAFATAMAALTVGSVTAADMDQTKMFDPMAQAEKLVVSVEVLGDKGNTAAGEVVVVKTPYGLAFYPNLKGLQPGLHGFHVHANGDCGPTENWSGR